MLAGSSLKQAAAANTRISSAAPSRIFVDEGKHLEWLRQFKYFCSHFSSAGSTELGWHAARLIAAAGEATAAFQQLCGSLWRQKCIETGVRMQVYRAIIQVLLYGSHYCWSFCAAQLEGLRQVRQRHHEARRILAVKLSSN